MKVGKAQLGTLDRIASGAFGVVYRCTFRLPGDTTPLAYKEFTTDHARQAQAAARVVKSRDSLSDVERAQLDKHTTWPRALVRDGGDVVGLLMPLLDAAFFCTRLDPNTAGQGGVWGG